MVRNLSWLAVLLLLLLGGAEGFIGMQWGRYATQSLVPSMVVDLLLQNGIKEIRLSSPSPNVMEALQSSELGVTVALQNDFIKRDKFLENIKDVTSWVQELLVPPVQRGVNIKTLVITEQPYTIDRGPIWNLTDVFKETVFAMQKYNLTHIKPTTSHFTDVLKNITKPSEADFREDIKDKMLEFLKLLKDSNSFFLYDMYPIISANVSGWPIEFAFMDNNSSFAIKDGKYTYRNAFEFMHDALVVALEKAGYPHMEIVFGEIGWPTDGGKHATPENAERFHRGFLKHIVEKKGTPRRPGKNIDVFLGSLTDENKFALRLGPILRHRGIYDFDGTAKYKIDFSGKGRDIYPATAAGTVKMPSRWCIFNNDNRNMTKVDEQFQVACTYFDCTSLGPDSSCSNLTRPSAVSYAFNMAYQGMNQDQKSCDFAGLGALTPFDPSVGSCKFPVEILTAERVDGGIQIITYVGYAKSSGDRLKCYTTLQVLLPIGLMLLFMFKKQLDFLV
ncbi:PREDICTED: glucan endo-1,3-beta-glucosidase 9-like [Ipomoea nil]|uniref:glucan endo-1,3-beta-glucosidase 9-like n=1 Tax=Ipomoea nil TaxID=35883 RepID=UPI000900AEDF|nr:PREDICTED: glucan endo-1,3-beta-glucosidase 9-like [Ipomoea nil]